MELRITNCLLKNIYNNYLLQLAYSFYQLYKVCSLSVPMKNCTYPYWPGSKVGQPALTPGNGKPEIRKNKSAKLVSLKIILFINQAKTNSLMITAELVSKNQQLIILDGFGMQTYFIIELRAIVVKMILLYHEP